MIKKYRGKRVDSDCWVYGNLFEDNSMTDRVFILTNYIHDENDSFGSDKRNFDIQGYEVIPESVGQFTGEKDKKNNKIYEKDIIGFKHKRNDKITNLFKPEVIESITDLPIQLILGCYPASNGIDPDGEILVIGNIIDNPELLEY